MLRSYIDDDYKSLATLLEIEGITGNEIVFDKCGTWVLDEDGVKGFFSLRMEQNMPYLVHFCVDKEHRCHAVARRLVGAFKNIVKSLGYKKAIINTPNNNNYLCQLVSRYFHVRPYADDGVVQFYLVEV